MLPLPPHTFLKTFFWVKITLLLPNSAHHLNYWCNTDLSHNCYVNEAQIMQNTKHRRWSIITRGCWLDYAVFNGHTVLRVQGVKFKRIAQLTIVLEF